MGIKSKLSALSMDNEDDWLSSKFFADKRIHFRWRQIESVTVLQGTFVSGGGEPIGPKVVCQWVYPVQIGVFLRQTYFLQHILLMLSSCFVCIVKHHFHVCSALIPTEMGINSQVHRNNPLQSNTNWWPLALLRLVCT